MRYVGFAWSIFCGLIMLAVVALLLQATNTRFETMVIAALVVIYATIIGTLQMLGRSLLHVSHKQLDFFIQIGKQLEHPNLEPYATALKEEAEETEQALPRFYISAAFNWLIVLIGTVALVLTALKS